MILMILYWVLFILNAFSTSKLDFIDSLLFVIAVLSTYQYFRERQKPYLSIENGIIKRNDLWGRSIRLEEVVHIEKYAGDYILKTPEKKLRIDTHLVESSSLEQLEAILSNLPIAEIKV